MDALSRLHLREAKGRFLALTGYPNDVEEAMVGELDAGFMAGVEGTDLILVQYRGGVMLARNLTGKEYTPGDIVQVKWMSSGRDPSLLKIIDINPAPTGDLYALGQWFTDATGVVPQFAYYSVDTTTGVLTSIGLPTPTWRDASSGLVRDGVLWVVGSLSVGQNAAVASYTPAAGWAVTDLGVKEQGIGGMVLDANGILYFATAPNLYGASVTVTMWEVSALGFANPMASATIEEPGVRVHGVGIYTAGLTEYPNRLVFFYSYVAGTETRFTSYDPNNDLERGPGYFLDGSGIFPSFVTYVLTNNGAGTGHTAEWVGIVPLLSDNYPDDPSLLGWDTNVGDPDGNWGAPHAANLDGIGAAQGIATLTLEIIDDPETVGGTNPHDAIAFYGSGAVDEDNGSQVDTLFFVGSSVPGLKQAIVSVQQDVIEDTAVRMRGGPRAGRWSGDKFYIPIGSPDGVRYTNEDTIEAGILSFDGTGVTRLSAPALDGDAGSIIRLYSEREGMGDKPIPLPVMYTQDQSNLIMLRENGDYELLGNPGFFLAEFLATTGYLLALGGGSNPQVRRYTRAAGWVTTTDLPDVSTSGGTRKLVGFGGKTYCVFTALDGTVSVYLVGETGNPTLFSTVTLTADHVLTDALSPGPNADYFVIESFDTVAFTEHQWTSDGLTASGAPSDGAGIFLGNKGVYVNVTGELGLLGADGSSVVETIGAFPPAGTHARLVYGDLLYYGLATGSFSGDRPNGDFYHYGAQPNTQVCYFSQSADGVTVNLISVGANTSLGPVVAGGIAECNGSLYFTMSHAATPRGVHRWNGSSFTTIYAGATAGFPDRLWSGGPI